MAESTPPTPPTDPPESKPPQHPEAKYIGLGSGHEYGRRPLDKFWSTFERDMVRVLLTIAIGLIFVFGSNWFAKVTGEPAFAPWGLFAGAAFFAAALSHILRRLLFSKLDLQAIARKADDHPIGAGLVFVGMCFVLGCFVLMMGSMFRT